MILVQITVRNFGKSRSQNSIVFAIQASVNIPQIRSNVHWEYQVKGSSHLHSYRIKITFPVECA